MSEREQVLATCAYLIGKYGEDSPRVIELYNKYNSEEYLVAFIEVVELCRMLADAGVK